MGVKYYADSQCTTEDGYRLKRKTYELAYWRKHWDLHTFIARLDDEQLEAIVTKRYGIDGNRPMRITELSDEFSITTLAMSNSLNKSNRKLRKLAQETNH